MTGVTMAKKKPAGSADKNKERQGPGFRTIGFRVSDEWAEWLMEAAKHDRMTIATFLDKAAVERARQIGFEKKPPERIP